MLTCQNMTVTYGTTPVITNAGFDLPPGRVTALIGPNGTGKSTLMKAIAGLLPAGGTVTMNDAPLPRPARQARIAYMPQDTGPASSLTLMEIVLLGRLNRLGFRVPADLVQAAQNMLDRFGLAHLQHRSLAELSGGQRQLALLAQALFRQPAALLLDEPTAALDLRHQLIVLNTVRHFARTARKPVLMAIHDLGLAAQFADHMICLHRGGVTAAGPPADVLTTDRLQDVYGVIARIDHSPGGDLTITPVRALDHRQA